jgi:uncharacterized BrkB/YihY/UPF0761 family membrane protein
LIGSVTGTVLFQLAKWGGGRYVTIGQQSVELYGSVAGLLSQSMCLYYASLVFLIGAEVSWACDHEWAGAASRASQLR